MLIYEAWQNIIRKYGLKNARSRWNAQYPNVKCPNIAPNRRFLKESWGTLVEQLDGNTVLAESMWHKWHGINPPILEAEDEPKKKKKKKEEEEPKKPEKKKKVPGKAAKRKAKKKGKKPPKEEKPAEESEGEGDIASKLAKRKEKGLKSSAVPKSKRKLKTPKDRYACGDCGEYAGWYTIADLKEREDGDSCAKCGGKIVPSQSKKERWSGKKKKMRTSGKGVRQKSLYQSHKVFCPECGQHEVTWEEEVEDELGNKNLEWKSQKLEEGDTCPACLKKIQDGSMVADPKTGEYPDITATGSQPHYCPECNQELMAGRQCPQCGVEAEPEEKQKEDDPELMEIAKNIFGLLEDARSEMQAVWIAKSPPIDAYILHILATDQDAQTVGMTANRLATKSGAHVSKTGGIEAVRLAGIEERPLTPEEEELEASAPAPSSEKVEKERIDDPEHPEGHRMEYPKWHKARLARKKEREKLAIEKLKLKGGYVDEHTAFDALRRLKESGHVVQRYIDKSKLPWREMYECPECHNRVDAKHVDTKRSEMSCPDCNYDGPAPGMISEKPEKFAEKEPRWFTSDAGSKLMDPSNFPPQKRYDRIYQKYSARTEGQKYQRDWDWIQAEKLYPAADLLEDYYDDVAEINAEVEPLFQRAVNDVDTIFMQALTGDFDPGKYTDPDLADEERRFGSLDDATQFLSEIYKNSSSIKNAKIGQAIAKDYMPEIDPTMGVSAGYQTWSKVPLYIQRLINVQYMLRQRALEYKKIAAKHDPEITTINAKSDKAKIMIRQDFEKFCKKMGWPIEKSAFVKRMGPWKNKRVDKVINRIARMRGVLKKISEADPEHYAYSARSAAAGRRGDMANLFGESPLIKMETLMEITKNAVLAQSYGEGSSLRTTAGPRSKQKGGPLDSIAGKSGTSRAGVPRKGADGGPPPIRGRLSPEPKGRRPKKR